ncbi:MAG: CYTH domain-containing protein [Rikenellaceae bacterium]|nr:CYTH domain-containing protein [Rikenellaceae bacterium]
MALEIERKFLVKGDYKSLSERSQRIVQGYLSRLPERTVRVRIAGDKAFLTIKGIGDAEGVSRREWEFEIPVAEAEEMIAICEAGVIDKVRHYVPCGDFVVEVDEFGGANLGLVVAEIELPDVDCHVELPDWLGDEVTGLEQYYNSSLALHPYSEW